MQLVIGLGNPGKQYAGNRHNVGFMVLDAIAEQFGVSFRTEARFESAVAKIAVPSKSKEGLEQSRSIFLLKPMTYMNQSGMAARKVVDYYKIPPQRVLVVVDDVALPFADLRLRSQGSTGGHNGLKSIQKHLQTQSYPRLRVGIGQGRHQATDHVLEDFTRPEKEKLPELVDQAKEIVLQLAWHSVADVMNKVNQKRKSSQNQGQEKNKNGRETRREEGQETTIRGDVHSQRSAE